MICVLCLGLWLARPPDAAALSNQAQELAAQKQYAQAEQLWKSAIEADPKYFPALFNLGYLYFSEERFGDGVLALQRAAYANPEDFNTRYLLGASLSRLNRTDDALRAWRSAQKLRPDHPKLLAMMIVEYEKGRYFSEAADLARSALRLSAGDENTHYLAIKALADAGDNEGAQSVAKAAVEKFPLSPRANFEYGFHLSKSGKTEEAIAFLRKAMQLDPKYEEPPYFLGEVMFDLGRNEEAIPFLRQAIIN